MKIQGKPAPLIFQVIISFSILHVLCVFWLGIFFSEEKHELHIAVYFFRKAT